MLKGQTIQIEPRSLRAMQRIQEHGNKMILLRVANDGITVRSIPTRPHEPKWEGFFSGRDVVWELAH